MARNAEVEVLSDPSASIMLGDAPCDALARGDESKDATAACDACPIAMSLLSNFGRELSEYLPLTRLQPQNTAFMSLEAIRLSASNPATGSLTGRTS